MSTMLKKSREYEETNIAYIKSNISIFIFLFFVVLLAEINSFPLGLLMVVSFVLLAFRSTELLLTMCFVSAIYSNHFLLINSVFPRAIEVITIVFFALLLGKRRGILRINSLRSTLLLFFIYMVGVTIFRFESIEGFTKIFDVIIAILLILLFPPNLNLKNASLQVLFASIVIISKIGVQLLSGNYASRLFTNGLDSGMIVLWENVNSNVFCVNIGVISCLIIGYTLIMLKNNILKIFGFILWALCIVVILRVGSRMVAISSITSFLILIFYLSKRKNNISLNALLKRLIIFVATFGILFYIYTKFVISNSLLAQRFTLASIVNSKGTGRLLIWIEVIDYLKSNISHLIFGSGLGSTTIAEVLSNVGRGYTSCHNIILEVLFHFGIIGTIIFVIIIKGVLRIIYRFKDYNDILIYGLAFICLLINGFGEGIYTIKLFWFIIMLILGYETKIRKQLCKT